MRENTKRLICCVLSVIIVLAGISVCAENAPATMNVSWRGNYTDTKTEIVVTFKSPATYIQQVTAVLYQTNISTPTFSDYLRWAEVRSEYGNETSFEIKLGDDLTQSQYKLMLKGNGYLASKCTKTVTVSILTPTEKISALSAINAANTVDALILALNEKVAAALQIDLPVGEELNNLISEILNVKSSSDYNGSFATLNDVREAYVKADVINYLMSSSVTAQGLQQKVEDNSVLFGIDVTDADYLLNTQAIYTKVISLKNTYKTTGIKTWRQLINAINETTAVEYVNTCNSSQLPEAVSKYKSLLTISNTSYADYLSLEYEKAQKVLRQIYQQGFTTVEQIKSAFETAVSQEKNPSPGGSLSGDSAAADDRPISITGGGGGEVTPPEEKSEAFSDVAASHWAHSYITALSSIGIISGYPDATFKPEATVTREEFVKMIVSAAGIYDKNAECSFQDVSSDDWCYSYVASAKNKGIISGISETDFGIATPVTRQDVAVIGARLLSIFKAVDSSSADGAQTSFKDNDEINDYARAGVITLNEFGIIDGFEDKTFKPKAYLTRAQAAKIIYMIRESI